MIKGGKEGFDKGVAYFVRLRVRGFPDPETVRSP
jgi:hypothetical protein